jgi:hypothetical protein
MHFDGLRVVKEGDDVFDRGGNEGVVSVQKQDHGAPARGEPGVEGGRLAAVRFQHRNDPVAVLRDDMLGAVRGTVVHDDDFRIPVGLVESAFDGLPEKTAVVVVVNDDANEW